MNLIDKLTGRHAADPLSADSGTPAPAEPEPASELAEPVAGAGPAADSSAAESAAPEALPELAALREEVAALRAALANERNRAEAPPTPPAGGSGGFYSPEEVRRMSPAEVRERMPAIRASMEKWH